MSDIGFIGLGNMGAALARRLMTERRLRVWDLDPGAVAALVGEGAIAADGPADNPPITITFFIFSKLLVQSLTFFLE